MSKSLASAMGFLACFMWFMPLRYVNFVGMDMYQAGNHVGGPAWLVIMFVFAYANLSWTPLHMARMLVSGMAMLICLFFLLAFGESTGWGLIALCIITPACLVMAFLDHRRSMR
jgi:hypothetical protein